MSKKVLYTIIFLLFTTLGFSQSWSRYKYEFYYGIGATNFMGDVSAPNPAYASPITNFVWVNFWNTVGFTSNTGLRYKYSRRQYFRANLFLGQLYAQDPKGDEKYWDRGVGFNSFYTEVAAKYEFVIWQEKKRSTVYRQLRESKFKNINIPTYLFIGVGGMFNVGKFSQISSDGRQVTHENFTNFAPVIPVGIGFKYGINKLTYINLEAEWHFTLSDGIDNAKGKDSPMYGEWFDQYQTITVNIVHKLRQSRSGGPKFRRR